MSEYIMPGFLDISCVFCKYPLVHITTDDKLFYCKCDTCGSRGPLETTKVKAQNRWIKGRYTDVVSERNKILQNIEINEKSYREQRVYYESKLKEVNSLINRKYKGSSTDEL